MTMTDKNTAMLGALRQYHLSQEAAERKRDVANLDTEAIYRKQLDDALADYTKRMAEIDAAEWPEEQPREQSQEEVTDVGTAAPTGREPGEDGGGAQRPARQDRPGQECDQGDTKRRGRKH